MSAITTDDLKIIYQNCEKSREELLLLFDGKYTFYQIKHAKTMLSKANNEIVKFIQENSNKLSASEIDIELKLGRNTTKTIAKAFNIQLHKKKSLSYSQEEIEFIKNNYAKLGQIKCAKLLNVTRERVRELAYKLGIKRDNKFSIDEQKDIKKMCKLGYSVAEIAIKYGRSMKTIYTFFDNNNIKINADYKPASKYKISAPELYIIKKMNELLNIQIPDKTKKENRGYYFNVIGKYEIDVPIYIGDLKFAIEYDGHHWHKDKKQSDTVKDKVLTDAGYVVFRINSLEHDKHNLKTLDPLCEKIANEILALVKRSQLLEPLRASNTTA